MTKIKIILEYISNCNNYFHFAIVFELVEFMVVLICFLSFSWFYSNHSMVRKCVAYVKKLSIFNKIIFIWFCIFYAIPNKIIINNNVSKFTTTFLIFLVLLISNYFLPFILLYIIFWVIVLESYFFAIAYKGNVFFKKFINSKLFKKDDLFAKEYFSFFWGNMDSGSKTSAKFGIVGSVLSMCYTTARNSERSHVRVQGQYETQKIIENSQEKPKIPQDYLAFQKEVESNIIQRDTTILKAESDIKSFGKKALDWVNDL